MDDAKKADHDHGKMKKLPPEGLAVSVALLHARHAAEDGADGVELLPHVQAALEAIKASYKPMQAMGWKKMMYAEAELMLHQASTEENSWCAERMIMMAHNSLRKALAECGIAEPTDAEIIAHAKAMKPDDTKGNARILGNFR